MMKVVIGLFTSFAGVGTMETDLLLGVSIALVGVLVLFSGVNVIDDMEYVK